jgi:toxin ParE1/3/4
MGKILKTKAALEDYLSIYLYIAPDNTRAAENLLLEFDEKLELLLRMPKAGRQRPEIAPNVRSFPIGSFVLFYREEDQGIVLLRVLHGARDLSSAWFEKET